MWIPSAFIAYLIISAPITQGNDPSKPSSSRMAISAIAHIMRITKSQLLELRDKCISLSEEDTDGQYQLKRSGFVFAMKDMNVADEPDYQILEKLFIMWDKDNKDSVDTVSNILCLLSSVCLCGFTSYLGAERLLIISLEDKMHLTI